MQAHLASVLKGVVKDKSKGALSRLLGERAAASRLPAERGARVHALPAVGHAAGAVRRPAQRRHGAGGPGREGGRRREAVGIIALFLWCGARGVAAF